jgi:hypothetical protein
MKRRTYRIAGQEREYNNSPAQVLQRHEQTHGCCLPTLTTKRHLGNNLVEIVRANTCTFPRVQMLASGGRTMELCIVYR